MEIKKVKVKLKKKLISPESLSIKVFEFFKDKMIQNFELANDLFFNPYDMGRTSLRGWGGRHISKQISDLKRSPYFKREDNKFYLTTKGRIKIIKSILADRINGSEKWDGVWRAVIFDIPVARNKDRDFLRRELKWMGFIEAQKSFWVTPFNVEKELTVLIKFWLKDFTGNIRVLKINKIDSDKDLKKHFNV